MDWFCVLVPSIDHNIVIYLRVVTADPELQFPSVADSCLRRKMYVASILFRHLEELSHHLDLLRFNTAIEFMLRNDKQDSLDGPFYHLFLLIYF